VAPRGLLAVQWTHGYRSQEKSHSAVNARDLEAVLLTRCVDVAQGRAVMADNQREANVFHVAAGIMSGIYPQAAERLRLASRSYLDLHPGERVTTAEVVGRGWVASLPRLRDMLQRQFAA
jgi:hypothetical protein